MLSCQVLAETRSGEVAPNESTDGASAVVPGGAIFRGGGGINNVSIYFCTSLGRAQIVGKPKGRKGGRKEGRRLRAWLCAGVGSYLVPLRCGRVVRRVVLTVYMVVVVLGVCEKSKGCLCD